ncbi:hypothetical protein ACIHCV_31645 [Streptomyces sp. NPDC051956]|uniref:hypothetical protein n=1 Tax=Streptomyces sp. NPDC051956 TaxID=3365677 RepID=UPI0037D98E01
MDDGAAVSELPAQKPARDCGLVQSAHEGFDIGLELRDLFGVRGMQLFEPPDLFTQPSFAVRRLPTGTHLVVELVPQVGAPLGEYLAGKLGLGRESDNRQHAVSVLGRAVQDAVHRRTDAIALIKGSTHAVGSCTWRRS